MKNKVDTYRVLVLYLITALLFQQPICVLTPLSILCILDFYGQK
jgi:hypothetical protein